MYVFEKYLLVFLLKVHIKSSAVCILCGSASKNSKNERKPAWLWGVHDIPEFDSVVSMTLVSLILQCQWHCYVWLCNVKNTCKINSAMLTRGSQTVVGGSRDYMSPDRYD